MDSLYWSKGIVLLLCYVALVKPPFVFADEYWIDVNNGADLDGCGAEQQSACYSYDFWYSAGCDSNGCANNITPGDTIFFRAGTYAGDGDGGDGSQYIGLPFNGDATAPVTVSCFDEPHSCIIDGESLVAQKDCPILGVGFQPDTSYCGANAANYLVISGFHIKNPIPDMYVAAVTNSNHIVFKNNILDGLGGTADLFLTSQDINFLTLKNNHFLNCPPSGTGCLHLLEISNIALVGNEMGPVNGDGNFDCNTLIGTQVGLVDGNYCQDSQDGIDQGRNTPGQGNPLERVIIRYNRISGIGGNGASRAIPLSGNVEGLQTSIKSNTTGINAIYKNILYPNNQGVLDRCFELYGGASQIEVAYNTCMGSATGDHGHLLWLNARGDFDSHWSDKHQIRFNIFDTLSTDISAPIVLDTDATTIQGCPTGSACPFKGNGIWMAERGGDAPCIYWHPSDRSLTRYSCAEIDNLFNTHNPEHSDNFHANPAFVDRSKPSDPFNLALTDKSLAYIDRGDSFCHTGTAAFGNTIPVTCTGVSKDPRYYFPQPQDYYQLKNEDCKDQGSRIADATNPGCFEIQVEGDCGVRQVSFMTANSITIAGAPCAWNEGDKVHVPWVGTAPDIGALEFDSADGGPDTEIDSDDEDRLIFGTPENFDTTQVKRRSISLSWEDVSGERRYTIQWRKGSKGRWRRMKVGADITTLTHKKLRPRTKYQYRIRADRAKSEGGNSDWSTIISVKTR